MLFNTAKALDCETLSRIEKGYAISVRISSIAHATEDIDKVLQSILNVCPEDFPKKLETEKSRGYYKNEIAVCCLAVAGRSKAEKFLDNLVSRMSMLDRSRLCDEAQQRIDDSGTFHLRLDKQEALRGVVLLADEEPLKVEIRFDTTRLAREEKTQMLRSRFEQLPRGA